MTQPISIVIFKKDPFLFTGKHVALVFNVSAASCRVLCQRLLSLCLLLSAEAPAPPVVFKNQIPDLLHAFPDDIAPSV